MPEILILPSRATRASYPLHLRIVCALVERLADLQVHLQHAHTAKLVRDFPARYPAIESLAASVQFQREQLQKIAQESQAPQTALPTKEEEDFQRMRAEVAEILQEELWEKRRSPKDFPTSWGS